MPTDAALPSLPKLVDGAAMARILQRSLTPGTARPSVSVHYLRYKPQTNLVVMYDVVVDGRAMIATAFTAAGRNLPRRIDKYRLGAGQRRLSAVAPVAIPLTHDADANALVQWYPIDIDIPALSLPVSALLGTEGDGSGSADHEPPRLLHYKPRRRAVVRWGDRVLKLYGKEPEFRAADEALRAASGLCVLTPRRISSDADHRVTVQAFMAGSPAASPEAAAEEAGVTLAALHRSHLVAPLRSPDAQLAAAHGSASLVSTLVPELRDRLAALLGVFGSSVPKSLPVVTSHGDFDARQLLHHAGSLGITDLDEMCSAPPALDVATYVSYVVRGRSGGAGRAAVVLDGLLRGYGERPDGLSWYLSTMLIRRSPTPFRYFEPNWPRRVERIVAAAEAALSW